MSDAKEVALDWVDRNAADLSAWTKTIWDFAEPAFREYRSAAWYVQTLEAAGFTVEAGSGGMPTAFCATYTTGAGPTVATYAEYDAVPGNCQAATTREEPRPGLSRHAAGHTDPHSALGISALGGALAAKAAMDVVGLGGTLKVFGEPAEKLRASKPAHAAHGLLRRPRRGRQLPPALGAAALQHRRLGHALRRRLQLRVRVSL